MYWGRASPSAPVGFKHLGLCLLCYAPIIWGIPEAALTVIKVSAGVIAVNFMPPHLLVLLYGWESLKSADSFCVSLGSLEGRGLWEVAGCLA